LIDISSKRRAICVDDTSALSKRCTKCHKTKPLDEFYRDKTNKEHNKGSWCKECAKAKSAKYRESHSEEAQEYSRLYYELHSEEAREYRRRYRKDYPEKIREENRRYKRTHPNKGKESSRRYQRALKIEILSYYSDGNLKCVICAEKRLACLSIDHIRGGGEAHRKEIKGTGGGFFYKWLKKNGYPNGYQVLCMNCQWIKREKNNECHRSI